MMDYLSLGNDKVLITVCLLYFLKEKEFYHFMCKNIVLIKFGSQSYSLANFIIYVFYKMASHVNLSYFNLPWQILA